MLELGLFRALFHSFGECAWELGEYHESKTPTDLVIFFLSDSASFMKPNVRISHRSYNCVDKEVAVANSFCFPRQPAFTSKAHHVDSAS